jgi:beta-glucanase (GH16 family)
LSQHKQSWKYGKIEVKAKLPQGQGIWPAIWMMPENDSTYGEWPMGGEIDLMELLGNEPNKIYGTIHYGNPHEQSQGTYTLPNGQSFADSYHVFTIEWEPGEIRWYVDGHLYYTANNWFSRDLTNEADYTYPAPFDQPFYMILNCAVGGTWPGNPDTTTVFPQEMDVDYVRVYQKDTYPIHPKPTSTD